ncbi:small ribosomal subunit protein mS29 isoform 1-T2 [Anomaloglossus baeobatrachus]|uniref:small ribosomal subunit protein mS29 n=1 Tax=Anomaloglossus baeobatrachus TaxID=238106 RepID=UPI003F502DDF
MLPRWAQRSAQLFMVRSVPTRGQCSAGSPAEQAAPRDLFRTSECDPDRHSLDHEGQFYSLHGETVRAIFPLGLPRRFQLQCSTFNETTIMVRRPALELIRYLRDSDFSQPALRYLLYGKIGTGKSLTMCHVVHYCHSQGWLILHLPDAHFLVKNCKELMSSSHSKERWDQPLEASVWLKNFRASNERFLSQIITQQRYVWSKREATEAGRPLGEVVDQGLTRVKTSSDVVGVVLKELKAQSGAGAFRLLVAVDGVNALWGRTTIKKEDKSFVSPAELTLVHNFRKMLCNDWTGGAIVTSVSHTGSVFTSKSSYLPQALLGKGGFDALDPFIPVLVGPYSEKEFESCYHYYTARRWLQHEKARTEEGKKEIVFLCNYNPREMEKICAFL